MAGSVDITGRQHYVPGIGHSATEVVAVANNEPTLVVYNPATQSLVSGDGTQLLDLGPVTAIGYNANGSVASVTTPSGVTSIAYDLAGKPTTVTSPSGVQTIAYNGNGTVASIS